ncbi:MAG TPA: M56 family metallopeptidase, partial [Thermoanaerobaculia bacterium]|nr:M56 family metallopeptidase [Thermoanaerobaculia bacterium]
MILASTAVALPLVVLALLARRLRSDLEEAAWRLIAIAMLLTPLVSLLPKIDVGLHIPLLTVDEVLFTSAPPLQLHNGIGPTAVVAIYAAIAIALLVRLTFAALGARKLRRDAAPFGDAYVSSSLRVPVTAGLLRPSILLPQEARAWSEAKLAAVLSHERAHVARRDPLWRFVSRLAAAVCWFHPLAWLAAASIERLAEEAADREAVVATGDRHLYADVLLELLRAMTGTRRRMLAPAILDGRPLGERIDAILEPARARRSPALVHA